MVVVFLLKLFVSLWVSQQSGETFIRYRFNTGGAQRSHREQAKLSDTRMLPDRSRGNKKKIDIKIKIQWKKMSSARPFSHSRQNNALTFVGSKSPDLFLTLVCAFVITGIL